MGLDVTKPILKTVSSATEKCYKMEISFVASLEKIISKKQITKKHARIAIGLFQKKSNNAFSANIKFLCYVVNLSHAKFSSSCPNTIIIIIGLLINVKVHH